MSVELLEKPIKSRSRKNQKKILPENIDHELAVPEREPINYNNLDPFTVDILKRMDRESFIYDSEALEEPEYKEWIWL